MSGSCGGGLGGVILVVKAFKKWSSESIVYSDSYTGLPPVRSRNLYCIFKKQSPLTYSKAQHSPDYVFLRSVADLCANSRRFVTATCVTTKVNLSDTISLKPSLVPWNFPPSRAIHHSHSARITVPIKESHERSYQKKGPSIVYPISHSVSHN